MKKMKVGCQAHRKTMAPVKEALRVMPVAGKDARARACVAAVSKAGLPEGVMFCETTAPEGEITIR
jgi:hypothetical protein